MSDGGDGGDGAKVESHSSTEAVASMTSLKINEDVYGDMILSMLMVDDLSGLHEGHKAHASKPLWISTSLFLYVLNLAMQVATSFAVFAQTIEYREDSYEGGLAEKKTASLQNSIKTGNKLDSNDEAAVLCKNSKVMMIPLYYLIVTLWYSRMVQELAEALWLLLVIKAMPILRDGKVDSIHSDEDRDDFDALSMDDLLEERAPRKMIVVDGPPADPSYRVVCLTPFMKAMLLCVIPIPKLFIVAWISWMGGKFLILAQDSASLILKALACSYFVTIDELLFKSFVSEGKKSMVRKSVINLRQETDENWVNWGSSIARGLVVGAMVLVNYLVFKNIFEFRSTCQEYKEKFPDSDAPHNQGLTFLLF